VLSSDAHDARELDRVQHAALNAEKACIPPERVANTWEPARLAAWAEP
jgi:histidinol phosphatase-like PHP family hydrolase